MTSKLIKLACSTFACLAAGGALAQAKTDGEWRGTGGAALAMNSGNTTSTNLQLNAGAARATADDKITLGGVINYAKSKVNGADMTTADKWAATGQYDFNLSPQTYAFGKLGMEGDKLTGLSLRNGLSGGLGFKVINTELSTFDLLGGLSYTTDKYSVTKTIGGKTDTRFSRASIYLAETSTHKLSSTVAFTQRLDLYPGLSGDKAMLAKFSAGLAVAMSSTLNLTVSLSDQYNSKPPSGVKKNDIGFFTGVNIKFGAL